LILRDDYEALHFVERVSKIYESYSSDKNIKNKLIKVLNSSPSRIREEFDENSEGNEEGKEDDMGNPNPFSPVKNPKDMRARAE